MPYNTGRATLAAMWVNAYVADAMTKAVCLFALEAVGRLAWFNGMRPFSTLLPGNRLNTQSIGCVCYEAPIAFALMANAISVHEANAFYQLSTQPNANALVTGHFYTRLAANIQRWLPGNNAIPAGALVYHGDTTAPCRHVTLSLGNGDVVSCWGAPLAQPAIAGAAGQQSESYRVCDTQISELIRKGLSPDTIVVPATSFTDLANNPTARMRYTNGPFWNFW